MDGKSRKLGLHQNDLTAGVYKRLKEAHIHIPFPQRDLHIRSIDDELLANLERP